MPTAAQLAEFVNANLSCFAIENHQGKPGPEHVDPVPVTADDFDATAYSAADERAAQVAALEAAVERAWLRRGDCDGINFAWINTCTGPSCDLPELPDEIPEDEDEDEAGE